MRKVKVFKFGKVSNAVVLHIDLIKRNKIKPGDDFLEEKGATGVISTEE